MMTKNMLTDAVTELDADILANYESFCASVRPAQKRKKRLALQWGAVAACALLLTGGIAAGYTVMHHDPIGDTTEDVLTVFYTEVEGKSAEYAVVTALTPTEEALLERGMGELYESAVTHELFRVKGEDDLNYLILRDRDSDRPLELLKFVAFTDAGSDGAGE